MANIFTCVSLADVLRATRSATDASKRRLHHGQASYGTPVQDISNVIGPNKSCQIAFNVNYALRGYRARKLIAWPHPPHHSTNCATKLHVNAIIPTIVCKAVAHTLYSCSYAKIKKKKSVSPVCTSSVSPIAANTAWSHH